MNNLYISSYLLPIYLIKSKRWIAITMTWVGILAFSQWVSAQVTTDTFNTTTTWTVPAGVTTVQVEAWGAGGSGGGAPTGGFNGGAGGAGGGAYARSLITVVPGQTYTITVGAGSTTINPGGSSWFINSTTILAVGGASSAQADVSPNGASGGSAASSIGSVVFSGGNGANGTGTYGGGSGSSAGNASNGINGSLSNGGTAVLGQGGGNGGNGAPGPGVAAGLNGSSPGGGGGGAYRPGSGSAQPRSTGANGRIIVTYGCLSPLSANVSVSNISCNGLTDGSINVTNPLGGAGTYEYRLNTETWQTSGNFTGLAAGSYNVQIRDTANPFCEATLMTVNIINPDVLSASVSKTDINCFGANNGAIIVSNPSGSNGTYEVSINGTDWFPVSTITPYEFNGLSANTYTVWLRDAAFPSCSVTLGDQTIIEPTVLNAVVAKTNISCFGDDDGTITVSFPSGGGGTYEVSIDNMSWEILALGGSYTFNNLTTDTYTVRIRDAALATCEIVLGTQTVTQPTLLTASAVGTPLSCFAGGSIVLSATGGTAPYTFDWFDLSGANNPQNRYGLAAGSYSVNVTDANGCQISEGPIVLVSATNCEGVFVCREGTSTVSVDSISGATGYSWTFPLGAQPTSGTLIQNTPSVIVETTLPTIDIAWSGVAIGQYDVCVEPTNDCGPGTEQCREIFVDEVILDITPNDILCRDGANGSIFLQMTQGVPPFTYEWSGSGGYTANVQNPEGLLPGTYNVTVADSKGCIKTASATITQPLSSVSVSGVIVNEDPFGTSNGSIDITVSGGTPNYTNVWRGPNGFTATSEDILGLVGGTYVVTVTDNNGCTLEQTFTVQRIGGPLDISALTKTDVLCFGETNGTINLEVIGGLGSYTYSWVALSGGPVPIGQTSNQDLSNLPAGEYQVTVSDGTNPDVVQSIAVLQPSEALDANAVATNIFCFGANNGSIDLTVTGGTAPYTYSWNNGSAAQDLVNIGPGSYNVIITDANGCTTTASTTIIQPPALIINSGVTDASCNILNSGAIDLSVSGGTPNYTFTWSNNATTEDISSLVPGLYSVTVTDTNGCQQTASFTVRNVCIDVTKTLFSGPTNNGDGTYTLAYQVAVQNTGNTTLQSVQVMEDLTATYATFTGLSITSAKFTVNGGFTGIAPNTELLSTGQTLIPGEQGFINISLTVTPGTFNNPYINTVNANAQDANGITTSDIDTENVNFSENPIVGIAKSLTVGPIIQTDGSYNLSFLLTVRNYGDVSLNNVQVTEDLDATFGAGTYSIAALSTSTGFTENNNFNGSADQNLLAASTPMAINEIRTITLSLNVTPNTAGPFNNQVIGTATGPGGTSTTDLSQNGANPDPDNDGDPTDNDVPTPVVFPENPEIGLAKRLVSTPINNNDGTYTLTYEFRVKNTGDVVLYDVQVTDNLTTTFGGAPFTVLAPTSPDFTVNGLYNGTSDLNLLSTTGNTLAVDETKIITLIVTVTTGVNLGPYNNTATSEGTSAFGTIVTDVSHNGISVDPENDGPGNNSNPTPVSFTENPLMGLAKTVASPINNSNGTYDVNYTIYVQNYGDVPLMNVQVSDDLNATFTGAMNYAVQSISASGTLTANTVGDFNVTNNLLLPSSSTLAFNTTQTITLVVRVTPGTLLGRYDNSATGTALSPTGDSVSDVSQNGTDPAPGGGNNPGNFSQPTPVSFTENPMMSVTKEILGGITSNGNNYTLTYRVRVENLGDVPLYNLQLIDNMAITFANAGGFTVNSTNISTQPASSTLVRNGAYNGNSNTNLLNGTGTLNAGDFSVIDINVTVTAVSFTHPGGPYINQVVSLATSPAGRSLLGLDDVEVIFFENPAIQLTKSVENVALNPDGITQRVTFRLQIENTGDVNLLNLAIYDDLLSQFSGLSPTNFSADEGQYLFINPDWDGTAGSNILLPGQSFDPELELNPADPNDNYHVFISFDVNPSTWTLGLCPTNLAMAEGFGPLMNTIAQDSDSIQVCFLEPALTLDKVVTSGLTYNAVGDVITYNYVITNSGDLALSGPFSVTDDKILVIADVNGPLAPEASVTATGSYTITQADLNEGFVTNVAFASTSYNNQTLTSNADTATVTAIQTPLINIVKTANQTTDVTAGQTITYTYLVENTGNVSLSNVVVSDVHSGVGALSAISPESLATLAPNGSSIFISTYVVTQTDIDNQVAITNIATVTADDPNGVQISDTDTESISPVAPHLNIQMVKSSTTVPNLYNYVGDTLTYDLAVTNTGNVTLTDVIVSDSLAVVSGSLIATLAPEQTVVLTASYIVQPIDLTNGQFVNIAIATGYYVDTLGVAQVVSDEDDEIIQGFVPDVTPVVTALPNAMQGITEFNVTVRVTELNNVSTNGMITVKIPKDVRLTFIDPFNPALTQLGPIALNNSEWSYDQDVNFHIFTSGTPITGGGFSTFGFVAQFDPSNAKGFYTLTAQIEADGGGEIRFDNNVDSEKLDYFIE